MKFTVSNVLTSMLCWREKKYLVIAFAEALLALTGIDSPKPASLPRHWRVDVVKSIEVDLAQVFIASFQIGRWRPNRAPRVRVGEQSITAVLSAECAPEQFSIRQTFPCGGFLRHWRDLCVSIDWDRLDQVEAIRFGAAPLFRRDRVEHSMIDHTVRNVIAFAIAWCHHCLSSVSGRLPTILVLRGNIFLITVSRARIHSRHLPFS